MMKIRNILICSTGIIALTCCSVGSNSSKKSELKKIKENSFEQKQQKLSHADSLNQQKVKPSQQDIYSISENMGEIVGKLKHNPLTQKSSFKNTINDSGNEIRVDFFYQNDIIYRIESRIYDKNNTQISYCMFDFDKENNCISITQRDYGADMAFVYAFYWGYLIKYDADSNLIDLNDHQKKEIIQSSKTILDSIMQHFPKFNYTFNWK